jgi:hypothetical protein
MPTADPPPVTGTLLPPEWPDGTLLHLPDLHGTGYTEVIERNDAEGHNDRHNREHDRHWWAYHRRNWIDWPRAVRLGAASPRARVLAGLSLPAGQLTTAGKSIPLDHVMADLREVHQDAHRAMEQADRLRGLLERARPLIETGAYDRAAAALLAELDLAGIGTASEPGSGPEQEQDSP